MADDRIAVFVCKACRFYLAGEGVVNLRIIFALDRDGDVLGGSTSGRVPWNRIRFFAMRDEQIPILAVVAQLIEKIVGELAVLVADRDLTHVFECCKKRAKVIHCDFS